MKNDVTFMWFFYRKLHDEIIKSHRMLQIMKLYMHRAIVTAWVVIVTTGIPAALSHGVVNYPYAGRNYTACLFLVDEGYNLVAFQVNYFFIYIVKEFFHVRANEMKK